MIFNSMQFIIFFAASLIIYYILPHKVRWIFLLAASCVFYMAWRVELIILILFSSFVNYAFALAISKSTDNAKQKLFIAASLVISFGLLFIFKYSSFFNNSIMQLFNTIGLQYPIREFDIILPMGISFYTFQAASYTIDVYNKKIQAEKNYFKFTLYITFFPQLVAGPIERADRLMKQLFEKKKFELENIAAGAKYMLFGFFKKIVIADRAAVLVNTVYNSPDDYSGTAFIIATFMFAFQIYCDFSGYSDIAIGAAKMLGINLMQNFNSPYFSKSIKEFWRHWHISLSEWFRDYVYIPLGGSRTSTARHYANLMLTFLSSGLWHGASWTFVIWGGMHGVYQIIGDIKSKVFKLPENIIFNLPKMLLTFCLICFAWIFFRANSINDAIYIISNLFSDFNKLNNAQYVFNLLNSLGLSLFEILLCLAAIALLILTEAIGGKRGIHQRLANFPFIARFVFYYIIAAIILMTGVFNNASEFIYFQF